MTANIANQEPSLRVSVEAQNLQELKALVVRIDGWEDGDENNSSDYACIFFVN